jgi:hypothetical protein
MVTVAVELTERVVAAKVAEVVPAGTVTLEGVVADELLSAKATTMPPLGAGPERVTVPVEELPPVTLDGFIESDLSPAGRTVKAAD